MALILEERLFLLMLALYASALLGGPSRLHRLLGLDLPVRWMRGRAVLIAQRLNRPQRSAATRRRRGLFLLAMAVGAGLAGGFTVHVLAEGRPGFYALEVVLLALLLPLRGPLDQTREVAATLSVGRLSEARQAALSLLRRDPEDMDAHTLCRACLEYLFRQSAQATATAFWYVLGGLPSALASALILRLTGASTGVDPTSRALQYWPQRGSQWLQAVPARIMLPLMLMAAPLVPGTCVREGVKAAVIPTPDPLLSVVSGLLNISLGGPRRWKGETTEEAWLGRGTARVTLADLRRGQWLYAVALGWLVLAVTAANL